MTFAPAQPVVNPRTGQPVTAAQAFAAWLERNEPDLFQALLKEAAAQGGVPGPGLGDWSDILSSVGSVASDLGSGISDAASSVGTWLTSGGGLNSLSSLASTYLQSQTAQSVTQMQLARASQGMPPAPVTYATSPTTGQVVPVYTGSTVPQSIAPYTGQPLSLGNGQTGVPLSTQALAALSGGGFLQQYLPYILLGGGLLLLAAIATMRK